MTGNGSITTTNGSDGVPKKVTFLSLPPIPLGLNADRFLPEDASTSNNSTVASDSRPDVGSSQNSTQTVDATSAPSVTSTNSAKPTYGDGVLIDPSLRSATPFSIGSFLPVGSWREGAEEDLITHLGLRERTRQEVVWEIVANEDRYGFYTCLLIKCVNCSAAMPPSCSR